MDSSIKTGVGADLAKRVGDDGPEAPQRSAEPVRTLHSAWAGEERHLSRRSIELSDDEDLWDNVPV